MKHVSLLAVLLLLCSFAAPARGALITAAQVFGAGESGPECLDQGTDSASTACGGPSLGGNALAFADYGSLGVRAEIDVATTVSSCDPNPFPGCGGLQHHAAGRAGFTDTLTVSDAALDGTIALIAFTWSLSGSGSLTTVDPSGEAQTMLTLALSGFLNGPLLSHFGTGVQQNGSLVMAGQDVTTPYATITIGSPFDIAFLLDASADLNYSPVGVAFSVDGGLAFEHTALLTTILVTDVLGNPLEGVRVSGASGRTYPPAAQPPPSQVPEPATGLLMLAGMALLLCRRRSSAS